ncbi:protein of unknown function [Methylocaldum szegediense]|uniref:Uncharacterized protein n=1 Tax=Methylocaldum szegediense TaxID=73780 RepID=A0ABM9I4V8_9GAMM|nr:protein of unknown function [Methylocaldum szegediense]
MSFMRLNPEKRPVGFGSEHDLSDRFQLGRVDEAVLGDDVNIPELSRECIFFRDAGSAYDVMDAVHGRCAFVDGMGHLQPHFRLERQCDRSRGDGSLPGLFEDSVEMAAGGAELGFGSCELRLNEGLALECL